VTPRRDERNIWFVSGEPYHLVMQLRRFSDASERPGRFEVTLTDAEGAGRKPAIGIAYLDLQQDTEPLPGPRAPG
jgi:hypothetical protein